MGKRKTRKFTEEEKEAIYNDYISGLSYSQIMAKWGITSKGTVHSIIKSMMKKYQRTEDVRPVEIYDVSSKEERKEEKPEEGPVQSKKETVSPDEAFERGMEYIHSEPSQPEKTDDKPILPIGKPKSRADEVKISEEDIDKSGDAVSQEKESKEGGRIVDLGDFVVIAPSGVTREIIDDVAEMLGKKHHELLIDFLKYKYGDAGVKIIKGLRSGKGGEEDEEGAEMFSGDIRKIVKDIISQIAIPIVVTKETLRSLGGGEQQQPVVIVPKQGGNSGNNNTMRITLPNGGTIEGEPSQVMMFTFMDMMKQIVSQLAQSIEKQGEMFREALEKNKMGGVSVDEDALKYSILKDKYEAEKIKALIELKEKELAEKEKELEAEKEKAKWDALTKLTEEEEQPLKEGKSIYDVVRKNIEEAERMVEVGGVEG